MNKKTNIVIGIIVLVLIVIGISAYYYKNAGEESVVPKEQPVAVAREFLNAWQQGEGQELASRIELVKERVTNDFVLSLDSKLSPDAPVGIDPVTCLTLGDTSFSIFLRNRGEEEASVEVQENIPGEDVFTSTIFFVNSGGHWKIREINCLAPGETAEILVE